MTKTIGALLDDFSDFHQWLIHAQCSIWILHAVARSGLLNHLDDNPTPLETLADRAGMKPESLRRVVNFLVSEEVLKLDDKDRIAHTAGSRAFQSRQDAMRWLSVSFPAGFDLGETMKTGVAAFESHYGEPLFEYLSERPDIAKHFGELMSSITSGIERFIFTGHKFKPFTRAVDVGGGHGRLLMRLLTEYPSATGVLFDLPGTAEQARQYVATSALKDRIEIIDGDFFTSVPAGGDLYLMKQILHDWSDEECAAILKNIRGAIAGNGRFAVIDFILPENNVRHPGFARDITMLTQLSGGRERRLSEFEALFQDAGFALDRIAENPKGQSLMEAVPV